MMFQRNKSNRQRYQYYGFVPAGEIYFSISMEIILPMR